MHTLHTQSTGLAAAFSLPEDSTIKFFQSIENGYKDNPYHNRWGDNIILNFHFHIFLRLASTMHMKI